MIDKKEFYNEILRIYNINGRIDINLFKRHSYFDCNFQYECLKYGGIKNICKELGLEYLFYNQKTKDEIFAKALNLLNKNGIKVCIIKYDEKITEDLIINIIQQQ